jgi:hypothetical protein
MGLKAIRRTLTVSVAVVLACTGGVWLAHAWDHGAATQESLPSATPPAGVVSFLADDDVVIDPPHEGSPFSGAQILAKCPAACRSEQAWLVDMSFYGPGTNPSANFHHRTVWLVRNLVPRAFWSDPHAVTPTPSDWSYDFLGAETGETTSFGSFSPAGIMGPGLPPRK